MPYADREERRRKARRWYEKNRERILAKAKRQHKEDPEPGRQRAKAAYRKDPEKVRRQVREWKLKNPERRKELELKQRLKKYKLDIFSYRMMTRTHGRGCWICGQQNTHGRRLAIDHCHDTGKVRGLLCDRCNRGLGMFAHSSARLTAASEYLKEHGK